MWQLVRLAAALALAAALIAPAATAQAGSIGAEGWPAADRIRDRVQPPEFPAFEVSVTEFGADPSGASKSTDAFREAIDAVSEAGGGRVTVPAGTFLTGAIHLKSNVNLHVADGAVVRFSQDTADYLPVVKTRFEGVELYNYSPFVYAHRVENVAITGGGTLDGRGDRSHWWNWKTERVPGGVVETADRNELFRMGEAGVPVEERVFGAGHFLRPSFVEFYESRNILVQGVTLNNSPMWLIHPVLSENVTIDGVLLESLGPNNDGVNPESSRDVLIKNTRFNTGDDCIAIKSGRNAEGRRIGVPSENILIEDNFMQAGHGAVVAGSEMSGSVRNVFAQDNVMDSPDLDRALRIKTNSVRGGVVENVYFRDNEVLETGGQVIWVDFRYEEGDAGAFTPVVRNIHVENVHSNGGSHAIFLRGYERSPITNINVSNSTFTGVDTPMLVQNVQGLRLTNVAINGTPSDTVVCQNTVWLGVPETLLDSSVGDRDIGDRSCLSEQFDEDRAWRSHGRFMAHVANVTSSLRADGVITDRERSALVRTAGRTDIGRR